MSGTRLTPRRDNCSDRFGIHDQPRALRSVDVAPVSILSGHVPTRIVERNRCANVETWRSNQTSGPSERHHHRTPPGQLAPPALARPLSTLTISANQIAECSERTAEVALD